MTRYQLYGGGGSPYSQKMRAILHYRRLPFDWVQMTPAIREQIKHDGPPVIPILRLPEDGPFMLSGHKESLGALGGCT